MLPHTPIPLVSLPLDSDHLQESIPSLQPAGMGRVGGRAGAGLSEGASPARAEQVVARVVAPLVTTWTSPISGSAVIGARD